MQTTFSVLSKQDQSHKVEICENEMIHVTWKDMVFSLNITGLIHLIRFLDLDYSGDLSRYFMLDGNMDDGFELWIHDVVVQLQSTELTTFRYLLEDALLALKYRSKNDGTTTGLLQFSIAMNAGKMIQPSMN